MKVENLKYLLRHGQESMTVMQIADALKEAHALIQKAEKMEQLLKEIQPNEIDLDQLSRLLAYSDKYEISIQFWPKQTAVYIAKDGVDLQDYGGDFDFAIGRSIEYLDRVTGNYR